MLYIIIHNLTLQHLSWDITDLEEKNQVLDQFFPPVCMRLKFTKILGETVAEKFILIQNWR